MNKVSLQKSILVTVFSVSLLWCLKSFEILFHTDLSFLGLVPGDWRYLYGILTAPLVHGSMEHLFNNTLPLLILGSVLCYGYPKSRIKVLLLVWLLSGLGVWLFARPATHLGASGVSHGIFFFLFVVSVIRRDKSSIAIMMIAFFMYGGMTMTIFPREPGISFEYHFFGAVAGVLSAILWHRQDPKPRVKRYAWEGKEFEDDPVIGDAWQDPDQAQEGEQDAAQKNTFRMNNSLFE